MGNIAKLKVSSHEKRFCPFYTVEVIANSIYTYSSRRGVQGVMREEGGGDWKALWDVD
jgi:hypothetical protein